MAAETISFKDLCIDSVSPDVLAPFWASALGLRAEPSGSDFRLFDGVSEHTLWVNKVPEPRTIKQRVHLDVHVAAVSDLTRLGAVVIDQTQPWTVLADPEGGELCAFVRDSSSLPDYRVYEVVVDAADPSAAATWWAERYDSDVCHDQDRAFSWIDRVPGDAMADGLPMGSRTQDRKESHALGRLGRHRKPPRRRCPTAPRPRRRNWLGRAGRP